MQNQGSDCGAGFSLPVCRLKPASHQVLALCAVALLASVCMAQTPGIVDDFSYPDDAAAGKAWNALWGTAPVSRATFDGKTALRFPCNFKGATFDRANWDRAVNLDMSDCRGLQFDILCRDRSPISHFSIYLQSGGGWYAATFSPRPGQWQTITLNKHDTRIEGKPAGWSAIRTIRLSAWRGGETDTEFYFANLRLAGAGAPVAILRNDSAAGGESRSVAQFAESMAGHLDDLGIDHVTLSDADLTPERLKSKRIVILPHCPNLPESAVDALGAYLDGGGKIAVFYSLPGKLSSRVGIDPGTHVRQDAPGQFASIRPTDPPLAGAPAVVKQNSWNIQAATPIGGKARIAALWHDPAGTSTGQPALILSDNCALLTHVLLDSDRAGAGQLLLVMLGHLDAGLWKTAATAAVERIGKFGRFDSFDAARDVISQFPAAAEALKLAGNHHDSARTALARADYPAALAATTAARTSLLEAWCLAQSPIPNEFRAFWCHSATGPAGLDWDQSIRILADNGFTAILPNMLWGGTAYYPSEVLPVAASVKDHDHLAECLAACRKYGVQCHVWKVNWNMSGHAPKDFVERMRKEGRIQVSFAGDSSEPWLCPSHPENQKLELDSMVEVVRKYAVDGIHFDYIRYPGRDGCFCPGCRERFESTLGRKIANWPADIRRDKALEKTWNDFRRSHITRLVAAVSAEARKVRPGIKISAAVFPNLLTDRDTVAQDWKDWCDRGLLDFVCPMDYTPDSADFEQRVARQLPWAGKVPCYPGIGLSTWPGRDIVTLIDQVQITRKLKTGGFIVFDYQAPEATTIVPLCGKGLTRRTE